MLQVATHIYSQKQKGFFPDTTIYMDPPEGRD